MAVETRSSSSPVRKRSRSSSSVPCEVRDLSLAELGKRRIEWAAQAMPVLSQVAERFAKQKPLKGTRVTACLHVTAETANLAIALRAGGAEVALCASNPLSTQDDVAAALVVEHGVPVFAMRGEDHETYYRHIAQALRLRPNLTMDDGADLVSALHSDRKELLEHVVGGTEETGTGVVRLRAMARQGVLRYPIVAVNDAQTKQLIDNRHGTGQSTLDGIVRATNLLIAGSTFVVAGYGHCGRGIALRARGLGANVIVTEVEPMRALDAVMDGFRVMPMKDAAREGDLFCTATGNLHVLTKEHFERMKDGAVICNAGHFNVELDLDALRALARDATPVREAATQYTLKSGKRIVVLAEGRLVNLAAAEGHPSSVMDLSFATQALSSEWMVRNHATLQREVYSVPSHLDQEISRLKLKSMGIAIDKLSAEQEKYLGGWSQGT